MKKFNPYIKRVNDLKAQINIRGRLVRETDVLFTFVICSNRCEKCPDSCFFTFFKGKYWKDTTEHKKGHMYDITLGISGPYLNITKIKTSFLKSCNNFGYVRGRIKEVKKADYGKIVILSNGIEIVNPNNKYNLEAFKEHLSHEIYIAVKVGKIPVGTYTNNEGKELERYRTVLTLWSKDDIEEPKTPVEIDLA